MSRYAEDPRVTAHANGFTVQVGDHFVHVLDSGALGWGAYTGPNLDLIVTAAGPWIGSPTADDLISALLHTDNS
ncbi:hypothetical protein F4553_005383 [Allocatelliglobosispora scoriae]|uniref:Uncharacterized protein n=1 Tax=Allocatelliglobosispora scoriae TaxID=643052 RepID=A0A841BUX5_9ACTN|nr:hypothetical protein [Allocatelliglobosispora scoriae]MBB5872004.1 hypothetical protein [Allocatelliglobosispora scoriae]